MPELQELGIGIFQQPDCGFRAGRCIENKGCIPSGYNEIAGIVGHVALKHFHTLLIGERSQFSTDNLADFSSVLLPKSGAVSGPRNRMQMNYGIVLIEPVC